MTGMTIKLCLSCGKECWHNPSGKTGEKRAPRCTYCGHPVMVAAGGKRDWAESVRNRQVAKSRLSPSRSW